MGLHVPLDYEAKCNLGKINLKLIWHVTFSRQIKWACLYFGDAAESCRACFCMADNLCRPYIFVNRCRFIEPHLSCPESIRLWRKVSGKDSEHFVHWTMFQCDIAG